MNEKLGEDLSPEEMDKVLEEQGKLQDKIDAANAWELDSRLELAMDALRLPPPDADVTKLSGGERRRVALCRLLLQSPDLLLLDEPTNHLDAESVAWLERFLKDYAGTVVAVTHDRYFLDNVAGWILELDRGRGIPWEGNYSSWLEQKQNRLAQEEKAETRRQRTLERELEWIRMSPRARQAKGKARLNAYEELLREDTAQKIETGRDLHPAGPAARRHRRRGTRPEEGLRRQRCSSTGSNFTLPRGGIVGVIGPNGAGKTTLFRMITGQEKPDGGTLRIGETVQIGYVDQSRDALDPNKTVWDEISGGHDEIELGKRKVASRAYVSWFNFKGGGAAAQGRHALGRRAQPRAPGEAAQDAAATCCCSTSRPTTSTSTRCARSKRRCSTSPAAPWSSATTAGSSTASPRTCSRSRATARSCGSKATTRTTRPTGSGASAPTPTSRIGSSIGS